MIVTLVAVTGLGAAMLYRVFSTWLRHNVASLADARTGSVIIFALASGVAEVDFTGHATVFNVTANQVNVRTLGVIRIILIVVNVGTVAVTALDILIPGIMAFFVRMAV